MHWIKYAYIYIYIYSLEKRIYKTFPPTPQGRKWNSTQAWKSRLERKWKRPNQFTLPFDKCSYWESKKGKKHLYPWEAKGSELTQSTGAASERCLVQPSLRHIAIPQSFVRRFFVVSATATSSTCSKQKSISHLSQVVWADGAKGLTYDMECIGKSKRRHKQT